MQTETPHRRHVAWLDQQPERALLVIHRLPWRDVAPLDHHHRVGAALNLLLHHNTCPLTLEGHPGLGCLLRSSIQAMIELCTGLPALSRTRPTADVGPLQHEAADICCRRPVATSGRPVQ